MKKTTTHRNDRGAVAITVASAMIVLMGMAALALDGSLAYNERRSTQNSADHAALAAAWTACTSDADPVAAGKAIAAENGYAESADISVEITPEGETAYRATITSTDETNIAGAIGTEEVTVLSEGVADCIAIAGLGDLSIFGGGDCGNTVSLTGATKQIEGAVHSNGDILSQGSSGTYDGTVTAHGKINSNNDDFNGTPERVEDVATQDYPVPDYWLNVEYWADEGNAQSLPDGNLDETFTGSGVYYFDGNITLNGVDLTDTTLVATGQIDASGPNNRLTPHPSTGGLTLLSFAPEGFYERDVTGACNQNAIHLSGSSNEWAGVIFAPNGRIQLSGSSAFGLSGALIGYEVRNSGAGLNITKNPNISGDPNYIIELIE